MKVVTVIALLTSVGFHCYRQTILCPGARTDRLLTPALKGIVVGRWSQDGKLRKEHVNGAHHNVFSYSADADSLQQELIKTFSYDGQTVIDATESGMLNIAQDILKSVIKLFRSNSVKT